MSDLVSEEIPILGSAQTKTRQVGRVYYYQGNIFQPLTLANSEIRRVEKAIRIFLRENRELVDADRAHPDYVPLPDLMDVEPYL